MNGEKKGATLSGADSGRNEIETSLSTVPAQTGNQSAYEADRYATVCGGTFPLTGRCEAFLLLTLSSGGFTDSGAKTKFVTSP